jgi:hypothetical protein
MSSARPEKPIASSWWRDKLAIAFASVRHGFVTSVGLLDRQDIMSYFVLEFVLSLLGDRPPGMITHSGTLPNRRLGYRQSTRCGSRG